MVEPSTDTQGTRAPVWQKQQFSTWLREVEVWEQATGLPRERRAYVLALGQTQGVRRDAATRWVVDDMNDAAGAGGVTGLAEELRKLSEGESTKGVDLLTTIINARRKPGEGLGDYVDRFSMLVNDLGGSEAGSLGSSEAGRLTLCVMLLKGSGLDSTRRQMLSASDCMKDVEKLARELKRGEEMAQACELREGAHIVQGTPDLSQQIQEQVANVLAAWKGGGKGGNRGGGWRQQQNGNASKGGMGGKSARKCWRCDRSSHVERDCYASHKADGSRIESRPTKEKGKGSKGFKIIEDGDSFPIMLVTLRVGREQRSTAWTWVVDSGASVHIASRDCLAYAHNVRNQVTTLTVANGESLKADSVGGFWLNAGGKKFLLKDVVLCQGCPYNILSVNSATMRGAAFEFAQKGGAIKLGNGEKLDFSRVNEEGGQFVVHATPAGESSQLGGEKRRETAPQ